MSPAVSPCDPFHPSAAGDASLPVAPASPLVAAALVAEATGAEGFTPAASVAGVATGSEAATPGAPEPSADVSAGVPSRAGAAAWPPGGAEALPPEPWLSPADAAGGSTTCDEGSSESGSTYPCASEATRTPR
jgi:hypothetical protein